MTGAQYRRALEVLDINQQAAGRLLGVCRRTAQYYCDRGPPEPVGRLLAVIIRHGISLEELDD